MTPRYEVREKWYDHDRLYAAFDTRENLFCGAESVVREVAQGRVDRLNRDYERAEREVGS